MSKREINFTEFSVLVEKFMACPCPSHPAGRGSTSNLLPIRLKEAIN